MLSRSTLDVLLEANSPHSSGIDLLILPDPCGRAVASNTEEWCNVLKDNLPLNTSIVAFNYANASEDPINKRFFVREAVSLLEEVNIYQKSRGYQRSIVFYCYSLAGVILKLMIRKAANQPSRLRDLLKSISGIVFLATPHMTTKDEAAIVLVSQIFAPYLQKSRKARIEMAMISDIALAGMQFAELKFEHPVLSCFETQKTRLRISGFRGAFGQYKEEILVDQDLARTRAPQEKFAEIDVSLDTICTRFSNSAFIHRYISNFLEQVIEARNALDTVTQAQPTGNPRRRLHSSSTDLDEMLLTPESSIPSTLSSNNPLHTPSSTGAFTSTGSNVRSSSDQQGHIPGRELSQPNSQESRHSVPVAFSGPSVNQLHVKEPCFWSKRRLPLNQDVQGRQDILDAMKTCLNDPGLDEKSLRVISLSGPGGIGKTQVALEYVRTTKESFDCLFWLDAGSDEKLSSGFHEIAAFLGLGPNIEGDPVLSRTLLLSWLANPLMKAPTSSALIHARWLCIFDNADKPNVLYDYFPTDGQGCVIITTRDPYIGGNTFDGSTSVNLQSLATNDAVTLFQRLLNRNLSNGESTLLIDVVERLDCFPLALVQMAGVMRIWNLTLAHFLEAYEHDVRRSEFQKENIPRLRSYGHTLATVWALERLPIGSASIMRILALMDSTCIQQEILTTKPSVVQFGDFPSTTFAYQRDRVHLTQASLIGVNINDDSVTVHPIIQDAIRAGLKRDEDGEHSFPKVFQSAVLLLRSVWSFATSETGAVKPLSRMERWKQCEKISPHVRRIMEHLQAMDEGDKRVCVSKDLVSLLNETAWYYLEITNFKACRTFLDEALDSYELCSDDQDTRELRAGIYSTEAALAGKTNDPDAGLLAGEGLLKIQQQLYQERGVVSSDLAIAYSEYGRSLILSGLPGKAEECFRKSWEIRESLPGFSRLSLFSPLVGLGWAAHVRGNFTIAAEFYMQALHDRQNALGPNDRSGGRTGTILFALGNSKLCNGEFDESLKYHEQALEHYLATVGENHIQTADTSYKVAIHCIRTEDYDRASTLLQAAAKVFKNSTSSLSTLARTQFEFANVLFLLGLQADAEIQLQAACDTYYFLVPQDKSFPHELQRADFDELIDLWSR